MDRGSSNSNADSEYARQVDFARGIEKRNKDYEEARQKQSNEAKEQALINAQNAARMAR